VSFSTRSSQPPNTDKETSAPEEGLTPDVAGERTPDVTDPDQTTTAKDGAPAQVNPPASDSTDTDTVDTEPNGAAGAEPDATMEATDAETDVKAPGTEAPGAGTQATAPGTADAGAPGGTWRDRHPGAARAVTRGADALAVVSVVFALLMPNQLSLLTPGRFAHIPAEAILIAGALLILPPKPRRVVSVLSGVGLGLLTILNGVDMGFYSVLSRPFYLVSDWPLFADGESFLEDSAGRAGAIGAVIGVVLLVIALLALMVLAILRLSDLMVRHRTTSTRSVLVLGIVWVTCATLNLQVAGAPLASRGATQHLRDRVHMVAEGLTDERTFARKAANDPFAKTPSDQLLTGLRGKDVIFTFIESYGRSAIEDPTMAKLVNPELAADSKELAKAGYSSRSAFLRSPTYGAGSWLAHSTFMSGLWVPNQQRYRTLTSHQRLTLSGAFRRTGAWRTVGIMPGVTEAWPERKFYGLDHVYDAHRLNYHGPKFSWSTMPDQYTLAAFQRLEHGRKHDKPLMTEMVLTSSHAPWAPIPRTVGWNQLGDGSIFNAIKKQGRTPEEVWRNADQVKTQYARSITYSVHNLVSYVKKYGNKNTVLVFLGDHQPVSTVSGTGASHDVPVAIVAHDRKVLDRISGWGWQDGLRPGANAPEWKMDTFRDRFLTAYGPKSGSGSAPVADSAAFQPAR
jgi:hypothetical protein